MLNKNLLKKIVQISISAGEKILDVYKGDIDIAYKDDYSPVTAADKISNQFILQELNKLSTRYPICSEEQRHSIDSDESIYWLVDPLDGTKEFINHNGEFTTNIALVKNGIPILGVVHAPALSITYYAAKKLGAWKIKNNKISQITVSTDASKPIRILTSRSHINQVTLDWISALNTHYQIIPMGSSLKICFIAEGKGDIYPRLAPTSYWDTAAAHIILDEAGGSLHNLHHENLTYDLKKCSLLNPQFIASNNLRER